MQNTANFQIKSGDPKNHLFSKFLIILHLEHVQEWEKQQFVIFNKTIGTSGRPKHPASTQHDTPHWHPGLQKLMLVHFLWGLLEPGRLPRRPKLSNS